MKESLEQLQTKFINYCFKPKKTLTKQGHIENHVEYLNQILHKVFINYGEEEVNNFINDCSDALKEVDEDAYQFLNSAYNFGCLHY